jgi:hypothetical protein
VKVTVAPEDDWRSRADAGVSPLRCAPVEMTNFRVWL